MSWTSLLLVLAAGINSCIGNLLLKQSRVSAGDAGLISMVVNPYFIGGLMFYGVNVILFAKALDQAPVSIAYPILAGFGFALLVLASGLIFGERMSLVQASGLLLVAGGIWLMARPAG
ncbi:MAG: small multidrug resistance protein [Alphaproteobacteria bacterium]|nr:small multidrug resistance protein [Alphaproteobacteria bacterium]